MGLLQPNRATFKFPLGATAVAGFNPLALPSLVVWLDPSQSSSVTVGSGGISQINDLSGNNNHFSQGTVGQRPDYTGTINALNTITAVSANSDLLTCVNSILQGPSLTIATVEKAVSVASVSGTYGADDVGANRVAQHRWDSATVPTTTCFPGGSATNVSGVAAPDITVAAHVFVSVLDNGAHTVNNFIDGTNNGSASGLAALPSATLPTVVCRGDSPGVFWNGQIGEIIVCNAALTTQQRQALESYLRAKWGTP